MDRVPAHHLSEAERLARIEAILDHHAVSSVAAAARVGKLEEHMVREIERHNSELEGLRRELVRYRGLVGGILLAITAIGTFIKLTGARFMGMFT